jgi:hypothetical protein
VTYVNLGKKIARSVHLFWRIEPALFEAWNIVTEQLMDEEIEER